VSKAGLHGASVKPAQDNGVSARSAKHTAETDGQGFHDAFFLSAAAAPNALSGPGIHCGKHTTAAATPLTPLMLTDEHHSVEPLLARLPGLAQALSAAAKLEHHVHTVEDIPDASEKSSKEEMLLVHMQMPGQSSFKTRAGGKPSSHPENASVTTLQGLRPSPSKAMVWSLHISTDISNLSKADPPSPAPQLTCRRCQRR
jgi:hypothetical protein